MPRDDSPGADQQGVAEEGLGADVAAVAGAAEELDVFD